jgi:hypothetical protein
MFVCLLVFMFLFDRLEGVDFGYARLLEGRVRYLAIQDVTYAYLILPLNVFFRLEPQELT